MEVDENGFLEELLALRRESWESLPAETVDLYPNLASFQEAPIMAMPYSSLEFTEPVEPFLNSALSEVYPSFTESFSTAESGLSCQKLDIAGLAVQESSSSVKKDEVLEGICETHPNSEMLDIYNVCRTHVTELLGSDHGCCTGRKIRGKRAEGQPSKNLMAERRRRQRVNDRLSMLRSVVPKISKMDRTAILGDAIDYVKELLERIKNLQSEIEAGSDEITLASIFKELKTSDMLLNNTPRFDVDRRETDTRIEICCAARPGLLLSTVNTLEALGLEIQQCVISCFNDFGMQASCSEEIGQREILSSEEIKETLFRNAGYGGQCS